MTRPAARRAGIVLTALLAACGDMYDQPKYRPYQAARFFPDGRSARQPVEDTVPRGAPVQARPGASPFPLSVERLQRGRERFEIHCAPCHGLLGDGDGMIVRRGFPAPPTFHQPRLREVPDVYFYDIITHGFGRMFAYASRVDPADRWAIAAYIRALQLSQNATLDDVPGGVAIPEPEGPP